MGVSKNRGTQQLLVFLLKMIILGCFGGTTIKRKHPYVSLQLQPCKQKNMKSSDFFGASWKPNEEGPRTVGFLGSIETQRLISTKRLTWNLQITHEKKGK